MSGGLGGPPDNFEGQKANMQMPATRVEDLDPNENGDVVEIPRGIHCNVAGNLVCWLADMPPEPYQDETGIPTWENTGRPNARQVAAPLTLVLLAGVTYPFRVRNIDPSTDAEIVGLY